ncbi:MAG TPA: DinB family protein [Promineifilum sp.]|nr:DinB family protein [Promineifilum sp.]HQF70124.1 DinB family protein [Promineifilum sp.]
MELDEMMAQMSLQAGRIRALADGVAAAQARWRPDAESWSILEVVNHLADEEREDFRTRLDFILHRPGEAPPPIDPQGWVTARGYNQRDLAESIDRFLGERQTSLAWLRGLGAPDWATIVSAPDGSWRIRAGDMAAAWVAHDLLHTRQLVELHWAWTQQAVAPYATDYAGSW